MKQARRSQRGQSLIEFLISFIMLMMLLMGTFDFGYAFLYWISIRDAAQEGAVYASLHPDAACQSNLEAWVRNSSASPVIDISDPARTAITVTRGGTAIGDLIKVEVSHIFFLHAAIIPDIIGSDSITLHAEVTVSVLQSDGTCH